MNVRTTCSGMIGFFVVLCAVVCCGAETLEISTDTTLDPDKTYGAIVITASDITIDGRGVVLTGPAADSPKKFQGIGILAHGVSRVTLKNIKARQWITGLKIEDGEGWKIENCDFSDNFHDPNFGWGDEYGQVGGLVLNKVSKSTLRKCRANHVWNGCSLLQSHDNVIEDCDFSKTSNTCLKLWESCRNQVTQNVLSYGLRVDPQETHARDSACVLLENGSNDNRFLRNDCTHGGDGIFIRSLNQWVSTGNLFEENDCSYAHNNCIEAWSPRNKYIRNKANHGSYGFWLGASDQSVLIGNEASFNGNLQGHHNSPHLPNAGHAGIVFMFGPASHSVVRGNTCENNNGAGIAFIGDEASQGKKWRAYHAIIEGNKLRKNRWGIYLKYADWMEIGGNEFLDNKLSNLEQAEVKDITVRETVPAGAVPPQAKLDGPISAKVGEAVVFDASNSFDPVGRQLHSSWQFGDNKNSQHIRVTHRFLSPGFFRVGLTVHNDLFSDLAWRDFYVVEPVEEYGTEANAEKWSWQDPLSVVKFSDDHNIKLAGASSVYASVEPYGGQRVNLVFPKNRRAPLRMAENTKMFFWLKTLCRHSPSWQDANPIITLYATDNEFIRLTPKEQLLINPPYNEARDGWYYFSIPLAGNENWVCEGKPLQVINYLTLGFDAWGQSQLEFWIDGLGFK